MDLLNDTVTLLESNETRADLYALWLDDYEVRTALTRRQADETLDGSTAVVVINREFAAGEPEKLLDAIHARNPVCGVAVTRDRGVGFPGVDPDHHLVKPVFEADLLETVECLLRRTNYRLALLEYYKTSSELASVEFADERPAEEGADPDRRADLEARVSRLKELLGAYRAQLDSEDVAAVMESISFQAGTDREGDEEAADSKYRPDDCAGCGRRWDFAGDDAHARGFKQLGSFVWRCVDCGHIQMQADPSHQRVGSYRV